MRLSKLFPSKYLSATDLDGRPLLVTITGVRQEEVGDSVKAICVFDELEKSIVLNVTNGRTIAAEYGDETDAWRGKRVELYPARVPFRGEMVDAIRVRAPTRRLPAAYESDAPIESVAERF